MPDSIRIPPQLIQPLPRRQPNRRPGNPDRYYNQFFLSAARIRIRDTDPESALHASNNPNISHNRTCEPLRAGPAACPLLDPTFINVRLTAHEAHAGHARWPAANRRSDNMKPTPLFCDSPHMLTGSHDQHPRRDRGCGQARLADLVRLEFLENRACLDYVDDSGFRRKV